MIQWKRMPFKIAFGDLLSQIINVSISIQENLPR